MNSSTLGPGRQFGAEVRWRDDEKSLGVGGVTGAGSAREVGGAEAGAPQLLWQPKLLGAGLMLRISRAISSHNPYMLSFATSLLMLIYWFISVGERALCRDLCSECQTRLWTLAIWPLIGAEISLLHHVVSQD